MSAWPAHRHRGGQQLFRDRSPRRFAPTFVCDRPHPHGCPSVRADSTTRSTPDRAAATDRTTLIEPSATSGRFRDGMAVGPDHGLVRCRRAERRDRVRLCGLVPSRAACPTFALAAGTRSRKPAQAPGLPVHRHGRRFGRHAHLVSSGGGRSRSPSPRSAAT